MFIVISFVIGAVAGFVSGALIFRNNVTKANTIVAEAKTAVAAVETVVKK